jgi:iduronate 2-sulfatase
MQARQIYPLLHGVFLAASLILLAPVGCGEQAPTPEPKKVAERPNVLFIAVDDLKPMLGCYGHDIIQSPNIDRLAQQGTVFLNAHCQQAACAPSRASLMTGLRPDTTRVWDLHTGIRDNLPDVVTLPQHFKGQGYQVVGMGKVFDHRSVDGKKTMDEVSWSVPYITVHSVAGRTFGYRDPDHVRAIKQALAEKPAGINSKDYLTVVVGKRPTDQADVSDEAYGDGAVAAEACRQITSLASQEKPFFLAVGFSKPSLPFNAPSRYWDLYDRNQIELAAYRDMPEGAPAYHFQPGKELRRYAVPNEGVLPDDLQRELIHGYYACVSYIDAQIGTLMDTLQEAGVADNTIIVLWGDHGWHLGDHSIWCKHTNYEQATRSPLILYSPKRGKANNTAASPVELLDIFPTLCELAGLPEPDGLQGVSLARVMDDGGVRVKPVAISQCPRQLEDGRWVMGYALRDDRYRYIQWQTCVDGRVGPGSGQIIDQELYDYETDALETRNLAGDPAYAPILARMELAAQDMNMGSVGQRD